MATEQFRRQLRREAEQWRNEGFISNLQYDQLTERYQFNTLEVNARDRFVIILMGLGGILLGLGVITFVAANWQAMSKEVRVALLLSVFIGVNVAGFYLWQSPNPRLGQWQQRLGQGLLLLGALILGANMALMSQMFHISGSSWQLFLTWGLGVVAMAYSLRLTPLAMLAVLLIGIGYWQGGAELFWQGDFSWQRLMLQQMPVLSGILFVPLAYWCRSRVLFVFATIAVISSLENSLGYTLRSVGWLAATAFTLPTALLWSYQDSFWSNLWRRALLPQTTAPFQGVARTLAVLFLSGLFYWFSFYWTWGYLSTDPIREWRLWSVLLTIAPLTLLAVWQWMYLWRTRQQRRRSNPTTIVMLGFIAVSAVVPFWHVEISQIPELATFLFNVMLFLLAAGLMREGLAQGQRGTFWLGIGVLTLQIVSRMLEYDTDLLFKSLVFALCGVGIIAAGLWFERYVRDFSNPTTRNRLPEELP